MDHAGLGDLQQVTPVGSEDSQDMWPPEGMSGAAEGPTQQVQRP